MKHKNTRKYDNRTYKGQYYVQFDAWKQKMQG